MVYANIKKTIAIDLSPLSPDLSRQDLVRILVNKFENVTIKAIQFVPVKLVHVTFEDSATRDHYAQCENLLLNGISCRVMGVGPQARTVFVYHYPYEEDDDRLKLALGAFGKVLDVHHQHHVGFNSVCTGTRLVKMVRELPIRRNLDVGGYRVKVWYVGQPLEWTSALKVTFPGTVPCAINAGNVSSRATWPVIVRTHRERGGPSIRVQMLRVSLLFLLAQPLLRPHKLLAVTVPPGGGLLLPLCCRASALTWFLGVWIGTSSSIASRWI